MNPGLSFLVNWYIGLTRADDPTKTASEAKMYLLANAKAWYVGVEPAYNTINSKLYQFLLGAWNGTHPPASNYQAVVLADNPLGYWRLEDAAGSVALNLGSSGQPGQYTTAGVPGNVALWVPRAPAAVASGQAVTLPTASFLGLQPGAFSAISFSCELWFKGPAGLPVAYLVEAIGAGPQINLQIIRNADGSLTAHRRNPAGVIATLSVPPLAFDVWHHVVYVRSAGIVLAIYVDGALATSTPDTVGGMPAADLVCVAGDPTGTNFTGGMIDEVAIYGAALTPAQVAAHYAARA